MPPPPFLTSECMNVMLTRRCVALTFKKPALLLLQQTCAYITLTKLPGIGWSLAVDAKICLLTHGNSELKDFSARLTRLKKEPLCREGND